MIRHLRKLLAQEMVRVNILDVSSSTFAVVALTSITRPTNPFCAMTAMPASMPSLVPLSIINKSCQVSGERVMTFAVTFHSWPTFRSDSILVLNYQFHVYSYCFGQ